MRPKFEMLNHANREQEYKHYTWKIGVSARIWKKVIVAYLQTIVWY